MNFEVKEQLFDLLEPFYDQEEGRDGARYEWYIEWPSLETLDMDIIENIAEILDISFGDNSEGDLKTIVEEFYSGGTEWQYEDPEFFERKIINQTNY